MVYLKVAKRIGPKGSRHKEKKFVTLWGDRRQLNLL